VVRIRLRRTGKKKQASYRVIVADSESPRDGRFIENIGFYNPRTDPPTVEIKADRALYWLSQGAQPSDAVARLLRKEGILPEVETLVSEEPVAESEETDVVEAEQPIKTEAEAEPEVEGAVEELESEPEHVDEPEPSDALASE
jgi:small subunit ribosomal protein S16